MRNRLFYLLFCLVFLCSCAKSIIGTHHLESKGWFTARLDIKDKQYFSYSESDDQASREGNGIYELTNDQLILNFGNNERFIPDTSIVRQPINKDTLVIQIFNENDKLHRLHYRIDSPVDRHDLDYFILIEPNESFKINIPFVESTKISLYTKNHRQVSYLFEESGFYTIRHKFILGPQFDISNTKWTFKILKNNAEELLLKKTEFEGYPILEFKKE